MFVRFLHVFALHFAKLQFTSLQPLQTILYLPRIAGAPLAAGGVPPPENMFDSMSIIGFPAGLGGLIPK